MSRDEAYQAAADQLGLIDWVALQNRHASSVEMPPYSWLKAEATAIVDVFLEASGIDPDKTYYTIDRRRAQELSDTNKGTQNE